MCVCGGGGVLSLDFFDKALIKTTGRKAGVYKNVNFSRSAFLVFYTRFLEKSYSNKLFSSFKKSKKKMFFV